jgi:hypothetical protein
MINRIKRPQDCILIGNRDRLCLLSRRPQVAGSAADARALSDLVYGAIVINQRINKNRG